MTTTEILAAFRDLADDIGSPPLWSDATLLRYLNEAQVEACRRSRLLEDRDTAEVCEIELADGVAVYAVDPRVLFIRRAKIDGKDGPLSKVDARDMDRAEPGWDGAAATPEPRWWMPWPQQKMRVETPDATLDTVKLRLWVVRDPLQPCGLGDPDATPDPIPEVDPEIPSRYHDKLVDWMLYRALSMRDKEEKYDPKSAEAHLAVFEAEFGKKSQAIDETWIQRHHGYDDHEGLF